MVLHCAGVQGAGEGAGAGESSRLSALLGSGAGGGAGDIPNRIRELLAMYREQQRQGRQERERDGRQVEEGCETTEFQTVITEECDPLVETQCK